MEIVKNTAFLLRVSNSVNSVMRSAVSAVYFLEVIIWLWVQIGINLHEWVFQKYQNLMSPQGELNLNFFKKSRVQINFKLNEKSCMITY